MSFQPHKSFVRLRNTLKDILDETWKQWRLQDFFVGGAEGGRLNSSEGVLKNELNWEKVINA